MLVLLLLVLLLFILSEAPPGTARPAATCSSPGPGAPCTALVACGHSSHRYRAVFLPLEGPVSNHYHTYLYQTYRYHIYPLIIICSHTPCIACGPGLDRARAGARACDVDVMRLRVLMRVRMRHAHAYVCMCTGMRVVVSVCMRVSTLIILRYQYQ